MRRALIVGAVLVLVVIALALSGAIDLDALGGALTRADYRFVPLMLLFGVLALAARAQRWRAFLGGRLPFRTCFHLSNIGYMFNNLLPLRAGEAVRTALAAAAQPPVPIMTTISTILLERIVDVLFIFAMLGAAVAALPVGDAVSAGGLLLAGGSFAGLIILLIGVHRREWVMRVIALVEQLLPPLQRLPLAEQAGRFLDGLVALRTPGAIVGMGVWTALAWLFSTLSGYALLVGFFGTADIAVVLLYTALSSFTVSAAAVVAYTPAGVGPYHASVIVALGIAGLTEPEGAPLAFAIVVHGVNLAMYIALGMIGIAREGLTLGDLLRRARAPLAPKETLPP